MARRICAGLSPEGADADVRGTDGSIIIVPLPGGFHRIVGHDPSSNRMERPSELALEDLRAMARQIAGTDFGMRDPIWLSRFSNAARQAPSYSAGPVLLAGDDAHIHFPAGVLGVLLCAGGVGMNAGIRDAHILGWKRAAVVTGRDDGALLDTYHEERHPVGAEMCEHTRTQNSTHDRIFAAGTGQCRPC